MRLTCGTWVVALVLAVSGLTAGATARGQESSLLPAGSGEGGLLSVEKLLADFDASISSYMEIAAAHFGVVPQAEYDVAPLRSALLSLASDGLRQLLDSDGSAEDLLSCLVRISGNGTLIANLAALARRSSNPTLLKEYVRTLCLSPLASPYTKGKVGAGQATLLKATGDLVVTAGRIWLESDRGFSGDGNGFLDPGEWASLKLGLTNVSATEPYLSASARLVLMDSHSRPCPSPAEGETAPLEPSKQPRECTWAKVLTGTAALPELSPGEQSTIGPFEVVLDPTWPGPGRLTFALLVEASGGKSAASVLAFDVPQLPLIDVASVQIDDDGTGESKGNGNAKVEPGEAVELRASLVATRRKEFSRVLLRAREYSSFLDLAGRDVGLPGLLENKPGLASGDLEFQVPTIEQMADVPAEKLDRQFFMDRKVGLWLAIAACAGKTAPPGDWGRTLPTTLSCPPGTPGYRFVIPVDVPIEFGQVFLLTSRPSGARIKVNGLELGTTVEDRPLVYTQMQPVKNNIVYYTIEADRPGCEPASKEVPVIFKDRTASNLTLSIVMELQEKGSAAASPSPAPTGAETAAGPGLALPSRLDPPVADPPPGVRNTTVPAKAEESVPAKGESKDPGLEGPFAKRGFALLAAPLVVRWFEPRFDGEACHVQDCGKVIKLPVGGLELGLVWHFTRNFGLAAETQLLFLVQKADPQYYAGKYLNTIQSIIIGTWTLEPRFRFQFWRMVLTAGMGFHLEGIYSDIKKSPQLAGMENPADIKGFAVALRVAMGLAVNAGKGVAPYVRGFAYLPSEKFDAGLSVGVEYKF